MIEHCRKRSDLQWLGEVFIALAHLDLRISELAGLRWSDIDLVKGFVIVADERASEKKALGNTVRKTKGPCSRVIPRHSDLLERLAALDR